MSGQAGAPSQFAQLIQVYEAMRRRWCGEGEDSGARLGLALLLRRGTKAWMQAQHEASSAPAIKLEPAVRGRHATTRLPTSLHTEAAALLLAMALTATRTEVSA